MDKFKFRYKWVVQKPLLFRRAEELLQESVKQQQITNGGPVKHRLEDYLCSFLKLNDHKCVQMTCSGTAALHALVSSFNIKCGKPLRWATCAFTFPSSILGPCKTSIVLDNDEEYLGPSLEQLSKLSDSFDGVIVTNVFGTTVNIQTYVEWCRVNKKLLIFDNAATPLTFEDGVNVCYAGDGAIVSFHETKALGRGEGGCIIANKDMKPLLERACNFGFHNGFRISHSEASNWRMSDINAAFILAYIETITDDVIRHAFYLDAVANDCIAASSHLKSFCPLKTNQQRFLSCICVFTDVNIDLKDFQEQSRIEAKKYYVPLCSDASTSKKWFDKIVCLPFNYKSDEKDICSMIKVLDDYIDKLLCE